MAWKEKLGIIILFFILYVGLGAISWGYDLFQGKTDLPTIMDYLTFQKFYDYSDAYEKRSIDFFHAETGTLKADAFLSLVLLGVAQVVALLMLTMIFWAVIPTSKKRYLSIAFILAFVVLSLTMFFANGDLMLSIFKPIVWLLQGEVPAGIDANAMADANTLAEAITNG